MYWTREALITGIEGRTRSSEGEENRYSDAEKLDSLNYGVSFLDSHVGFYVSRAATTDENGLYLPPPYMSDQVLFYVDGVLLRYPYEPGETLPDNVTMQGWVYNQSVHGEGVIVGALDSDGTEVTIDTGAPIWVGDVGHIQVGLEVIRYNGIQPLTSTTWLLQNLERNQNGSGAIAHLDGAAFDFAIYGDHAFIRNIIQTKASEYLHQLYITDGSPTEISHHQWAMRWNNQQVNNFWRTYVPGKKYVQFPMRRKY